MNEMKRVAHETQQPRPIDTIGECARTEQRSDSRVRSINQRFLSMIWYLRRCLSLFFLLPCWLPVSNATAQAEHIDEYQVKAAFIYNFIAFTNWPGNTEEVIQLCIYGKNFFGDEIAKLENKSIHGHPLRVSYISDSEKLGTCQVIFFAKSIKSDLLTILNKLQDAPILTLADSVDAIEQGVMINMHLENGKIVFEINLATARKSGLEISSRLLQLAVKVYQ